MNLLESVRDALRTQMKADPRVVVLGEDIGKFGGVFRATSGLYDELAARCGVSLVGGRERISAVLPTDEDRKLLEVPADVACFQIER